MHIFANIPTFSDPIVRCFVGSSNGIFNSKTSTMLNFSFKTSAPGYKKKQVFVIVGVKGSSTRSSYAIPQLSDTPLNDWDSKSQRFKGGKQIDVDNNKLLDDLQRDCEKLLQNPRVTTPQDFVKFLRLGAAPDKAVTLAEYIEAYIAEQRKNATCNYQLYLSLLHNLRGENHKSAKGKVRYFPKPTCNGIPIADTPIAEVGDAHLYAFAKWINTEKNGKGYKNLNTNLKSIVNVAINRGDSQQVIRYKASADAKKRATVKTDAKPVLTLQQFKAVEALAGTIVDPNSNRNRAMQPIYLDTALLMYYTQSRPADVIQFRADMIRTTEKGNKVLRYIPAKKRTHINAPEHVVDIPLNNSALAIIEKYKNQSKGGYLLPLPMNETHWDITDISDFKKWRIASNTALGNINSHLKKIGQKLGLDFPLTLYVFRHSVITHQLNAGVPLPMTAKRSGTSMRMIDKHYYMDVEY